MLTSYLPELYIVLYSAYNFSVGKLIAARQAVLARRAQVVPSSLEIRVEIKE